MPERRVISNTSPLLYLHQVGRLELLPRLYEQILVPSAVDEELRAGADLGVDVPALSRLDWLEIRQSRPRKLARAVTRLGAGEAGVIALALDLGPSLLLMDDRAARRAAKALGLTSTGTLGILLKAKEEGLIDAVAPAIEDLKRTTMWLADGLIRMGGARRDRGRC